VKRFFLALFTVFVVDQLIKLIILGGFRWESECISIVLVYNEGVAFSMFAFLGEYLKYIQLVLISTIAIYSLINKEMLEKYALPLGIVVGAGGANILDRFVHGGVVDYVYWHCWFDFAIFNFADVMIDVAILLIILISLKKK